MDQCSYWHDIPSALQATSPNWPGHDLAVGINDHPSQTQCSPASGSMISLARIRTQTRQRHADRHPLVSREPNPDDARSTMVCLLPAGRAAIQKAAPGHVQDVRRNFIDLFTPAELDTLATLNERVLHHLATNYDSPAEDEPSLAASDSAP